MAGTMVAVKVTDWLTDAVASDDVSVVVAGVLLTVRFSVPVLVAKFASPVGYTAVTT
jgi:hypothetical protein